jgi:hypothetical protein
MMSLPIQARDDLLRHQMKYFAILIGGSRQVFGRHDTPLPRLPPGPLDGRTTRMGPGGSLSGGRLPVAKGGGRPRALRLTRFARCRMIATLAG